MVEHIYPRFLRDNHEYTLAEGYWHSFWEEIDPQIRTENQWTAPWFKPLPASLSEGNPIFTAVSRKMGRGIRVIQHEPTQLWVEIQAWFDSFGGNRDADDRVEELVISCALSDSAATAARALIRSWIRGEKPSLDSVDPTKPITPVALEAEHVSGQIESLHGHRSSSPD